MPYRDSFERNEAKLCSPINTAPRPLSKPPVSFFTRRRDPSHFYPRIACPRRRQLFSEAVAGCGRRLHRRPPSTGLAIWRRNLIQLRTPVPATLDSATGQDRTHATQQAICYEITGEPKLVYDCQRPTSSACKTPPRSSQPSRGRANSGPVRQPRG